MKDFSEYPLLNMQLIEDNFQGASEDPDIRELHIELWEGVAKIFSDIDEALTLHERMLVQTKEFRAIWDGLMESFDVPNLPDKRVSVKDGKEVVTVVPFRVAKTEEYFEPACFFLRDLARKKWHSIRGYAGGVGLFRVWNILSVLDEDPEGKPIETVQEYVRLMKLWAKESILECEKLFPYLKQVVISETQLEKV